MKLKLCFKIKPTKSGCPSQVSNRFDWRSSFQKVFRCIPPFHHFKNSKPKKDNIIRQCKGHKPRNGFAKQKVTNLNLCMAYLNSLPTQSKVPQYTQFLLITNTKSWLNFINFSLWRVSTPTQAKHLKSKRFVNWSCH